MIMIMITIMIMTVPFNGSRKLCRDVIPVGIGIDRDDAELNDFPVESFHHGAFLFCFQFFIVCVIIIGIIGIMIGIIGIIGIITRLLLLLLLLLHVTMTREFLLGGFQCELFASSQNCKVICDSIVTTAAVTPTVTVTVTVTVCHLSLSL